MKLTIRNILSTIVFSGALLAGMTQSASAGLIAVVADVNADGAGNFSFYDSVLGSNQNVVFSRDEAQQEGVRNHYNTLAGVTATENSATLTAGLLGGLDMLVVTRSFNVILDYTAAEISAVADFVSGGGTVLAILEASTASTLTGYNNFLAGIGSAVSYNGGRSCPGNDTMTAASTSLGVLGAFTVNCYNHLAGGTAVYTAANGVTVAFGQTTSVSEPPVLALLGLGLLGLGFSRRKQCA
ncbi:MAG: PEP-CTERM sorting domain-containing protein [Motiliproteus sp.]